MAAQGGSDEPVFSAMPVHDVGAGTVAAFGVLTALFARQRLGTGQEVKVSLAATTMTLQAAEMTSFAGSGAPLTGGRDFAGPSPYRRLYRCRDGWIALNAEQSEFPRQALAEVMGAGENRRRRQTHPESLSASSPPCPSRRRSTAWLLEASPPSESSVEPRFSATAGWRTTTVLLVIDDSDVGPVRAVGGFADWTSVHDEDRPEEHHFSRALGEDTVAVLRAAGVPAADLEERCR